LWLVAATKGGRKVDDFLIDKFSTKGTGKAQIEAVTFANFVRNSKAWASAVFSTNLISR
jgi:hypothetical protein